MRGNGDTILVSHLGINSVRTVDEYVRSAKKLKVLSIKSLHSTGFSYVCNSRICPNCKNESWRSVMHMLLFIIVDHSIAGKQPVFFSMLISKPSCKQSTMLSVLHLEELCVVCKLVFSVVPFWHTQNCCPIPPAPWKWNTHRMAQFCMWNSEPT